VKRRVELAESVSGIVIRRPVGEGRLLIAQLGIGAERRGAAGHKPQTETRYPRACRSSARSSGIEIIAQRAAVDLGPA
jgi:hypothetical protein